MKLPHNWKARGFTELGWDLKKRKKKVQSVQKGVKKKKVKVKKKEKGGRWEFLQEELIFLFAKYWGEDDKLGTQVLFGGVLCTFVCGVCTIRVLRACVTLHACVVLHVVCKSAFCTTMCNARI